MKKPIELKSEITRELLPRLQDEFNAYYFYRSASNWCKGIGFNKAASFFAAESDAELVHAKKIEDFLVDWNVIVDLPEITKPKSDFESLVSIIELAYDIEYKLYQGYEKTSISILKTGDVSSFDFLQEFRTIQLDSVKEYSDMLNILEGVEPFDKFKLLLLEEQIFGG